MSDLPSRFSASSAGHGHAALEQTVAWGFKFLYAGVLVLVVVWLLSGFVSVDAGQRALVLRFGEIVRSSDSGLVWAWPRPFESVELVPGPQRQLSLDINALTAPKNNDGEITLSDVQARNNGYVLSGDGGVLQMGGTVIYQVTDATLYLLARDRLAPLVQRVFCASAISAVAARPLDGVVISSAESAASTGNAAERDALREDIRVLMNKRLLSLQAGIMVSRVDVTVQLPSKAVPAFQQVAGAEAEAARMLEAARKEAENYRQLGESERVAIEQKARGAAQEMIASARVATANIVALSANNSAKERQLLLQRLYRERMETIMRKAASVSVVDGREAVRVVVPNGNAQP
jgi:regulator of protease activity HflC (stomatin/prohibitin superfamily)